MDFSHRFLKECLRIDGSEFKVFQSMWMILKKVFLLENSRAGLRVIKMKLS
jgi:hypothetical protein